MKKQFLIVEHRNSAAFLRLKDQVAQLLRANAKLHKRIMELEMMYGNEVYYNAALCDLLRAHGIAFRQVFSAEYRQSRK